MRSRRDLLRAVGAAGIAGLAGCSQSSQRDLGLPDEQTYERDEWATTQGVRLKTESLRTFESVEYNNPEEGAIKTWSAEDGHQIVITDYWVENLTDEEKDWPHWENFQLVTPDGTVDPRLETPDGTTVEEVEASDGVPVVSWVDSSGLSENYERGWSGVFHAPAFNSKNYAVKWSHPDFEPVYWRS